MGVTRPDLFDGVVPFVATAEARSFRQAARALRVTTSAVSKAIARLEAEVGVRLLHRSSRSVALTSEGEAFLLACRNAVGQLEAARELLSAEQAAPRGLLRVSLPSTFGRRVVGELPALLAAHPSLLVEVLLSDRFVQLGDENIDVAVRIGTVEDSRCIGFPLRKLRMVTAAAPSYLRQHGVPLCPADLAHHNCLQFLLPNGLARAWSFAHDAELAPPVAGNFRADHGEPLLAAALAGLGLVQAPDVLLAPELSRGELVEVLRPHAAPGPPLTALCSPGRQRSPKVRALVEVLKRLCDVGSGAPDVETASSRGLSPPPSPAGQRRRRC